MRKSSVIGILALYVVCSHDGGLTRTIFENVHNLYYAQQCLVFNADHLEHQVGLCDPAEECVVYQGVIASSSTVEVTNDH